MHIHQQNVRKREQISIFKYSHIFVEYEKYEYVCSILDPILFLYDIPDIIISNHWNVIL